MPFEFTTANRIIFGAGKASEAGPHAATLGSRALVITGKSPDRAAPMMERLISHNVKVVTFAISEEPTIERIEQGLRAIATEPQDGMEIEWGMRQLVYERILTP